MVTASLKRCLIALSLLGFVGCVGDSKTPEQAGELKPPEKVEKEAIAAIKQMG